MNADELDPVEARVIQDLHRRNWIIKKESHKEYGRILATAKKQQFSSILQNSYLNRLDEAVQIAAPGSKEWIALGSVLRPVAQDVEMFEWVVGTHDELIGIDEDGHLYVSNERAVQILRSEADSLRGRLSTAHGIIAVFAFLLVGARARARSVQSVVDSDSLVSPSAN